MEELTKLVSNINSFIWGMYCLIPLLCGVGIYFTIRLKFIQVRKFGQAVRMLFGDLSLKGKRADKHGMSSFQSVATAIAAQVGTGNLAGAATAIAMGGPGAIFWMWIAAFFGMATIFAEAVLAQVYRTRDDAGHITGGPAYYISKGLGSHKLAVFFSVSIIIALGCIGNMVQSNSIADA
ncbi:MAG: alanine:cation symporter family protein, partial [Desulfovibrio piger]